MSPKLINSYSELKLPYRFLIFAVFFVILCAYWLSLDSPGAGTDILWRVSEGKYFLQGINPYDVFIGHIPIVDSWGKPATYSFISYIFVFPLTLINNTELILICYSCIDIFCLFAGVLFLNKIINKKLPAVSVLTLVTVAISLITLRHIFYLNYGIIAVFGLLLTVYAIPRKLNYLLIIGVFLVGLKPSLALPMCLYFIFCNYWRALFVTLTVYFILGLFMAIQLSTPLFELIEQLQKTQQFFSGNGFYRYEGILLFLRPWIMHKMVFIGLILSGAIFLYFRERLKDPIVGIILIITLSLSFFFNQEHAWSMAYPIIFYAAYLCTKIKTAVIPLIITMVFITVPSNYVVLEAAGYINYMNYHNILRFGLLIIAAFWLVSCKITKQLSVAEDKSKISIL
jgi:hypothetical protein